MECRMEEVRSYKELKDRITAGNYIILYFSSPDCGVCHADFPRIEKLVNTLSFPGIKIEIENVPEASGQLGIFTVPAVLLYYQGKEFHRQVRFIDFTELEKRMTQLKETDEY